MGYYWHTIKQGVYVTVHLITDHEFKWFGIYGLQIGNYFIGVIKGNKKP